MAPEAFDGKRNEQTDIWSVGIIFYQLLNGHLPFPNDDLGILLKSIFFEPPASFSKAIPKSIESVVLRSLAKAPSERYHTASEMLSDLQSQAVKIDLILEPASQPKGQEESWDGGKSQEVRSKPRAHHYAVVHRVLRDNAFSFPATLVDNLIGPKGEDYMKIKWEMNVGSRMTGDEHTDEDVPAEGIECYSITVGTGFRGALVKFPKPVGPTEAFFAAIVIPKDAKAGDQCGCRYFTLEFSPIRINGTILGEWDHEKYLNYRDGPPPTKEAFLTALEPMI